MDKKAGLTGTCLWLLVAIGTAFQGTSPYASAEIQTADKPSGTALIDAPFKGTWAVPTLERLNCPDPVPQKGRASLTISRTSKPVPDLPIDTTCLCSAARVGSIMIQPRLRWI